MRVVVMDRELHEPLTILNIPSWLSPDPRENRNGQFMGKTVYFHVPVDIVPFYKTDFVAAPEKLMSRHTSITLEPVMRTTGTSPTNRQQEIIFWYAYADQPELALLLRAAFLPGQESEMQMREKESEARGVLRGFGLALGMEDPDDLF